MFRTIPLLAAATLLLASGVTLAQTPRGAGRAEAERPDPIRPGERAYKYWEQEGVGEMVVDDEGRIYRERQYGGVVPSFRDLQRDKKTAKVHKRKAMRITWLGFQQKALFSRIFIQADRMPTYNVFKPDPLHIVVELPGAKLRTAQEGRQILTHEFNSKVDHVAARVMKGKEGKGVQVVITLKEPVGFLYKQDGNYVYVDVER